MADIEVWGVEAQGGTVTSMRIRFKGTGERTIDRDTALRWLAEGHSLVLYSGSPHHGHRGAAVERVEVNDTPYLRTDTLQEPKDHVHLDSHGGH